MRQSLLARKEDADNIKERNSVLAREKERQIYIRCERRHFNCVVNQQVNQYLIRFRF